MAICDDLAAQLSEAQAEADAKAELLTAAQNTLDAAQAQRDQAQTDLMTAQDVVMSIEAELAANGCI